MNKHDKIKAIVEAKLSSMELGDLERYYVVTQTFEYGTYASDSEIDEDYITYVEG